MRAKRRLSATVWAGGIGSSDWPPNKGLPAKLAGARWVRRGKEP